MDRSENGSALGAMWTSNDRVYSSAKWNQRQSFVQATGLEEIKTLQRNGTIKREIGW